jgi:hypothetical protein
MLRICDGSMMAAALKVLFKCFWIAPLAKVKGIVEIPLSDVTLTPHDGRWR